MYMGGVSCQACTSSHNVFPCLKSENLVHTMKVKFSVGELRIF